MNGPTVLTSTSPGPTRSPTLSGLAVSASATGRPPSRPASASSRARSRPASTGLAPAPAIVSAVSRPVYPVAPNSTTRLPAGPSDGMTGSAVPVAVVVAEAEADDDGDGGAAADGGAGGRVLEDDPAGLLGVADGCLLLVHLEAGGFQLGPGDPAPATDHVGDLHLGRLRLGGGRQGGRRRGGGGGQLRGARELGGRGLEGGRRDHPRPGGGGQGRGRLCRGWLVDQPRDRER